MAEPIKYLSLLGLSKYDEELKKYIGELLTAANGDITAVTNLVNTLIGTEKNEDNSLKDAGKSVRTIANEELAAQLLSGEAEADFKTLQELAAWLEDHPEEAAAINLDLQNIHKEIGVKAEAAEEGKDAVAATGIYKYVDDAVAGKNVDAEGDDVYVSATAADNKVSVEATYGTLTAGLEQSEEDKTLSGTCSSTNGIAKAEDVATLVAANEAVITAAHNDHEERIVALEEEFNGDNNVDNKIENVLAEASALVEALGDTDITTNGKTADEAITVSLGGTVGAPTIAVAHNFVAITDDEITALFEEEEEGAGA